MSHRRASKQNRLPKSLQNTFRPWRKCICCPTCEDLKQKNDEYTQNCSYLDKLGSKLLLKIGNSWIFSKIIPVRSWTSNENNGFALLNRVWEYNQMCRTWFKSKWTCLVQVREESQSFILPLNPIRSIPYSALWVVTDRQAMLCACSVYEQQPDITHRRHCDSILQPHENLLISRNNPEV